MIVQYKDIYLHLYQSSYFKNFYHLKELEIYHETRPYTNLFTNWDTDTIREKARASDSEGFVYAHYNCYASTCTCHEILIENLKEFYKIGKNLVEKK